MGIGFVYWMCDMKLTGSRLFIYERRQLLTVFRHRAYGSQLRSLNSILFTISCEYEILTQRVNTPIKSLVTPVLLYFLRNFPKLSSGAYVLRLHLNKLRGSGLPDSLKYLFILKILAWDVNLVRHTEHHDRYA